MPKVVTDPEKVPGEPGSLRIAAPERAQRVSQAEMLRAMMARWESVSGERTAVELTRNAQGKVQVKVSVHDSDPNAATAEAQRIFDALTMIYPYDAVERPA